MRRCSSADIIQCDQNVIVAKYTFARAKRRLDYDSVHRSVFFLVLGSRLLQMVNPLTLAACQVLNTKKYFFFLKHLNLTSTDNSLAKNS